MEIHQIEFPDGSIHEIEAPEGATQEQIINASRKFYAELKNNNLKQEKEYIQPYASVSDALLQSAVRNIPFGTDIQAAGASMLTGVPFKEAKNIIMDYTQQVREQRPKSSIAGSLGGAVTSGTALIPAKIIQGGSVLSRALGSGIAAGGLGFGYGAQEGDSIGDRIGSGFVQAGIEAPLGAAGSVVVDSLLYGGRELAKQAREGVSRYSRTQNPAGAAHTGAGGQAGNDIIETLQGPLKKYNPEPMQQGNILPLSRGQASQVARQQALEAGALAGQYGDDARVMALRARELQADKAKEHLSSIAGSQIEGQGEFLAGEEIYTTLKQAYKIAKQKTRDAYQGLAPERVSGYYVRDTIIPAIREFKTKGTGGLGGFDLDAPNMAQAKYFYNQIQKFNNKHIKDINLGALETWRGSVKAATRKTDILPAEKMFLEKMVDIYDEGMDIIPREALKSGDDTIFNKLVSARKLRAEQGRLFEREKMVKDILEKDFLTPEQMANLLFSKGKTFRSDASTRLTAIMRASGEKADEIRSVAKTGTYSNIFKNSLMDEVKEGTAEKMLSFNKLETNLDELINKSPSYFKQLHPDESERRAILGFYEDVKKIKSMKPGTVNYSNTAYTLLDFLNKLSPSVLSIDVPLTGSLGGGLKQLGEAAATQDLRAALGPILQETIDGMESATFNFLNLYGRDALVAAFPTMQRNERD